jgi:hypothetical protein
MNPINIFICNNVTLVSIVLFIILFYVIKLLQPGFLFKPDGSMREFGIGYKNKTILPLWLVAILLSMLCYLGVLYYVTYF